MALHAHVSSVLTRIPGLCCFYMLLAQIISTKHLAVVAAVQSATTYIHTSVVLIIGSAIGKGQ